ncbi:MAG: neuraminidase-like domain-containing protein [Pirellulales bacterium]
MKLQGRSLSLRMKGEDVTLLHGELRALGYRFTAAETSKQLFGASTRQAVMDFQKKHRLEATGVVDERTAKRINAEVGELPQPEPEEPRPDLRGFVVRGQVRRIDGSLLVDGTVRAFDKDLRSEETLGAALTGRDGCYKIKYTTRQFRRAEKQSADLIVRVFSREGLPLAASPIIFNARPEEIVDLVIGGEEYRGPSEYEQHLAELTPVLQGVELADLTEEDVAFLAGETGIDPEHIAFLVVGARLGRKTDLRADAFYGLFRQSLPTDLPTLLAQSPEVQRRALETALDENVIPVRLRNDLDSILERLRQLIVEHAFQPPDDPGRTSLGDLLNTVLPLRERQKTFLSRYVRHEGPVVDFWKGLRENPEFRGDVENLQLTLQLGALTQNHLPLVRELRGRPEKTLKSLAKMDAADWRELIRKQVDRTPIGFPPDVPGEDDEEKTSNYAEIMTRMLEDAFPTAAIASRIAKDNVPAKSDLLTFFVSNPTFDFRTTLTDSYLAQNPSALDGVDDKAGLTNQLKSMQRVFKLTPRYSQMRVLLANNLNSAHAITRMAQSVFVQKYGEPLGGAAPAKAIYENALQTSAMALSLLARYSPAFNGISTRVAPNTPTQVEGLPDWETLFGSFDLCDCEHCRSVYSPAAYLVDILAFLNDRPSRVTDPATNRVLSAREILFKRRPDIGEIELTCENTNTVMPYVDLVAEVLEDTVAPPPDFSPFELDSNRISDLDQGSVSADLKAAFAGNLSDHASIRVKHSGEWWVVDDLSFSYSVRKQANGKPNVESRSRQTSGTQQERAANPQYVNPQAYARLKEAVFRWGLPFDQSLEEARAYLAHLGVPRHQIVEAFLAGERSTLLGSPALAAEYLGLSGKEVGLVSGADPAELWVQWGFEAEIQADGQTWLDKIAIVDEFLRRSGLEYRELVDLLQMQYVNPGNSLTIVSTDPDHPDTCDTSKLELRDLNPDFASRMVRFVRLWRKLSWTMFDLDRAISSLGGDLTAGFLVQLSHLSRLHTRFNLPVGRLSAFWAPLDTVRYTNHGDAGKPVGPSLYEQLFRSRASINPLDPGFPEDPDALTGTLTDHADAIAAALEIGAADLHAIVQCARVFPHGIEIALDLDNLSRLYRHVTLAKALKLRVQDYLRALDLIDGAPFSDPTRTVLFAERVAQVRESGFSFAELDYLLRHESGASSGIALEERVIVDRLRDLRQELQKGTAKEAIARKLAETLGFEMRTLSLLEPQWASLMDPALAAADEDLIADTFPQQVADLVRLHKISVIAARFNMTAEMLEWLLRHGDAQGVLDLTTVPTAPATPDFAKWMRLVNVLALRPAFFRGEQGLLELLALAHQAPAPAHDELLDKLVEQTTWNSTDLGFLVGADGFALTLPDDLKSEKALLQLRDCFAVLKRLGISAEQAKTLSAADVTPEIARAIRQAVRAKYEEAQWSIIAKPLRDMLREKQRSALVDYLIARSLEVGWQDADGLYAHFLIDVEMDPCTMTSRIKQALSSVQLFVQRCLMSLEPEVAANADVDGKWREWKWMKNYRVWEANRKVFLYPENWIEPELRDDKSPFFEDLENELLQADVTTDTAEAAFLNYLEKLDTVAHLAISGMYHQVEKDQHGNTVIDLLHVFGRTHNTPHVYYYRQRVDSAYWTAWEKVEVDIEGDQLIPVIWNRRPYLFWPVFTEKQEERDIVMPKAGEAIEKGQKYWEIQLAWSEYKNKKWSGKKISKAAAEIPHTFLYSYGEMSVGDASTSHPFFFEVGFEKGDLAIVVRSSLADTSFVEWGRFRFFGCDGKVEFITVGVIDYYDAARLRLLPGTHPEDMSFVENRGSDNPLVLIQNAGVGALSIATLRKTPGTFRVKVQQFPYVEGYPQPGTAAPFFYADDARTFFVTPGDIAPVEWSIADRVQPGMLDVVRHHYFGSVSSRRDLPRPGRSTLSEPSRPVEAGVSAVTASRAGGATATTTPRTTALAATVAVTRSGPLSMRAGNGREMNAGLPGNVVEMLANRAAKEPHFPHDPIGQGWVRRYRFEAFYHPHACLFVRELNRDGIDGLLQRPLQLEPHTFLDPPQAFDFAAAYDPDPRVVLQPHLQEDVDFSHGGAYAHYNWELFFHAPLIIADRLSKNQQFEEAQKWFHYIFDPTDTSAFDVPQKYWRTRPFYETANPDYVKQQIKNLLERLELDEPDPEFNRQVSEWRHHPFNPHLIARLRATTYQKTVVMKYIDNLIAWGDQLFRRDTIETLNEATQLYILAAEILGRRPDSIPPRATPQVQTYNSLEPFLQPGDFSDPLVAIENLMLPSTSGVVAPEGNQPTMTLPTMLYFGVPKNEKLLRYWDTVADRLFKIRHCMNIEGVVRQLPLFEPPIDPALLIRAAALGVDLTSALNDISAALPHYRFNVMAHKAGELCADLKALGGALLSALEKRDAEALALLRSTQEIQVLHAVRNVKEKHIQDAKQALEGLKKTREMVNIRHTYYASIQFMNPAEIAHVAFVGESLRFQAAQAGIDLVAAVLHLLPNVKLGAPTSIGTTHGGQNVGSANAAFSDRMGAMASISNTAGSMSATLGGYQRRRDEWKLQERLAAKELQQIEKQISGAEIRLAIAERELLNHDLHIENAKAVDAHMHDKFTNRELYDWMVSQISSVYFQSYQLTYDVAKHAERAYRYELGLAESNFIQFGYWDSLKKGLLAGERLTNDIRRMEAAYLEQNSRDLEITKHISLAQFFPLSLLALKEAGACTIVIPEWLFDMDYPGHYFRRLKSVSVSIPCVVGPYTSINCTLTLTNHGIRVRKDVAAGYGNPLAAGDDRFFKSAIPQAAIATSHGQNDSGMFELNFNDERFLPFEGAGAVSEWRLELPRENNQFVLATVSDVILHVRYTARPSGDVNLTQKAKDNLAAVFPPLGLTMFVLNQEFSSEWHRFLHPKAGEDQTLSFELGIEHIPFYARGRTNINLTKVDLIVEGANAVGYSVSLTPPGGPESANAMDPNSTYGGRQSMDKGDFAQQAQLLGDWQLKIQRAGAADFKSLTPEELQNAYLVLGFKTS